jgi:hypothetical protein
MTLGNLPVHTLRRRPSKGSEGIMKTALIAALLEGQGFLQDQGWHQTAQLMTVAANEIERLSERVRELEDKARPDPQSLEADHSTARAQPPKFVIHRSIV